MFIRITPGSWGGRRSPQQGFARDPGEAGGVRNRDLPGILGRPEESATGICPNATAAVQPSHVYSLRGATSPFRTGGPVELEDAPVSLKGDEKIILEG